MEHRQQLCLHVLIARRMHIINFRYVDYFQ
jgi:hypothetical protein